MEQLLTVFGVNWKLLLAQGFNFALLLIVLTYFLYKPVLKIIDERREKIAQGVKTAEAAARKLEEAKKESDSIIGSASREAEGLVAVARNTHRRDCCVRRPAGRSVPAGAALGAVSRAPARRLGQLRVLRSAGHGLRLSRRRTVP